MPIKIVFVDSSITECMCMPVGTFSCIFLNEMQQQLHGSNGRSFIHLSSGRSDKTNSHRTSSAYPFYRATLCTKTRSRPPKPPARLQELLTTLELRRRPTTRASKRGQISHFGVVVSQTFRTNTALLQVGQVRSFPVSIFCQGEGASSRLLQNALSPSTSGIRMPRSSFTNNSRRPHVFVVFSVAEHGTNRNMCLLVRSYIDL